MDITHDNENNIHIFRDNNDLIDLIKERLGFEIATILENMLDQANRFKKSYFALEQENEEMVFAFKKILDEAEKIRGYLEVVEESQADTIEFLLENIEAEAELHSGF